MIFFLGLHPKRLEEKITNLELEDQVLQQEALSMAPNKFLSIRSRSILQVLAANIMHFSQYKVMFLTSEDSEMIPFVILYIAERQ